MMLPVTPRPRSLARNTAVSATSAGSQLRRRGARAGAFSSMRRKILHGAGRRGLHRSGRNRVDANVGRTQVVGEIAHRGFERRLGHAHHVIIRHHARGAQIRQRDHRAARGHQRGRGARHRDHRIRAHILRQQVSGARGLDERAAQILAVGERDAVNSPRPAGRALERFRPRQLASPRPW